MILNSLNRKIMEINLDDIRTFKGPYEEIPDIDPIGLQVYNLIFLGEMNLVEKISYTLYVRCTKEAEKIYESLSGGQEMDEVVNLDEKLFEIFTRGNKKEKHEINRIIAALQKADSWYSFFSSQVRQRFCIPSHRGLFYLPGFLILSFSSTKEREDDIFSDHKEFLV